MSGQGSGGNVLAALCSVFVPGLGQLVQGRIFMAFFFFLTTGVSYALGATIILFFMLLVGAVFHLWSIIDAARFTRFPL